MRIAAILFSVALVGAALAQEGTPAPESAPTVQPASESAPPAKTKRYVNEKGETLICKPVSGSTGTRLKGRGRLICGTQTEWDDSDSEINQLFDNMIRTNTPSPRG